MRRLTSNSISITGLVVLGGNTSVPDPGANFRDVFAGTTSDANGLINALVKITFSYQGYQNCFNVMNEIKVCESLWEMDGVQPLTILSPGPGQNNQEICTSIAAPCGSIVHAVQRGVLCCCP